jgi:hypothetical protein
VLDRTEVLIMIAVASFALALVLALISVVGKS